MTPTPFYAVAHNLIGFKSSSLRVKVTRIDGDNYFVTTADLLDAGTRLVLAGDQIAPEEPETVLTYKTGLVSFS